MPRFFSQEMSEKSGKIRGADAMHIAKVLRMNPGEEITVCDLAGTDYTCRILSADCDEIDLEVIASSPSKTEPSVDVTLYMALPKGDKMELIVQKCVELGVNRIVPMLTARCVSRPDEKSMQKKTERYRKIAYEASKQCGRGKIPTVDFCMDFGQAVNEAAAQSDLAVLFYECSQTPLKPFFDVHPQKIAVFVGSEGGFEPQEAALAEKHNITTASLGPRILRCETAAIVATTAVMLYTENL